MSSDLLLIPYFVMTVNFHPKIEKLCTDISSLHKSQPAKHQGWWRPGALFQFRCSHIGIMHRDTTGPNVLLSSFCANNSLIKSKHNITSFSYCCSPEFLISKDNNKPVNQQVYMLLTGLTAQIRFNKGSEYIIRALLWRHTCEFIMIMQVAKRK